MKIFVTGGTGFIGTYLAKKLLLAGHDLLILSRTPMTSSSYVQGSLSNFSQWSNQVKRFRPQATVHLAWEGLPNYDAQTSIKNLNYGLALYKFLSKIGCELILTAGSGWEYGTQTGKVSENGALKPLNDLAAAKITLQSLGEEIAKENNIKFVWVRIFYVYGVGQRETSLVPRLINSAITGEAIPISNLRAAHDFVYVEDVAEAISAILKKTKTSSVFNIGSGKLTTIKKIIEIVEKKLRCPIKLKRLHFKNNEDLSTSIYADISKLKNEVGWWPKTDIVQGIGKTIQNLIAKNEMPSLFLK